MIRGLWHKLVALCTPIDSAQEFAAKITAPVNAQPKGYCGHWNKLKVVANAILAANMGAVQYDEQDNHAIRRILALALVDTGYLQEETVTPYDVEGMTEDQQNAYCLIGRALSDLITNQRLNAQDASDLRVLADNADPLDLDCPIQHRAPPNAFNYA